MSTQAAAAVKPSLTLKRRLNATPEKVFAAWIDPEKVKRWMGPEGIEVVSAECEPRVGGRYRWIMRAPDGEVHNVSGEFREFLPNEKLVFSWAWITTPERVSQVTVKLKPDGDGTLLTLTHEQFFDEAARDHHQQGWTGCMNKLERFFSA